MDTVIHFAGVLFKARPEKFLPITNLGYFRHLVDAAGAAGVSKVILISFPHVEGETFPESPATGSLDGRPESVHARTRLEEEKYLFETENLFGFQAVSLRLGMVYGNGILMIDAARWMAKRWILGVWREPTWIHLISTPDYLAAATAAIRNKAVRGIYHIGDEGRQTLQEFLDIACAQWRVKKPWRLPVWMIYAAAAVCEAFSGITGVKSPLTRDFITIGRQSYHGDTSRMRNELLPELKFPTLETGKALLRLRRGKTCVISVDLRAGLRTGPGFQHLMRIEDHDREKTVPDDFLGHASEDDPIQAFPAVSPHDDQVDPFIRSEFKHFLSRVPLNHPVFDIFQPI